MNAELYTPRLPPHGDKVLRVITKTCDRLEVSPKWLLTVGADNGQAACASRALWVARTTSVRSISNLRLSGILHGSQSKSVTTKQPQVST